MSGTDYTTTPNLGLVKPVPYADVGQWGNHWNANADKLDTAYSVSLGGYLPLAGGTVTGPLTLSSSFTWNGTTATGFGTGIGQVPVFVNYQGSGLPGLRFTQRLIMDTAPATASDFATLQINRTTAFSSSAGNLNSALRLAGSIGASDGSKNWLFQSVQSSSGNASGHNVAAFLQASRLTGGTDLVLSAVSDARDTTGLASSAAKEVVALELDVECNRADDGVNTGTFGGIGIRKAMTIVAFRYNTADTTQTEVSHGIWMTAGAIIGGVSTSDTHINYQSAIGFGVNTQLRQALDTRGAITPTGSANPVSAVTMSAGHIIDFNGGPALNSAPGNYWWYDSATSRMKYNVGATTVLSIDASGNVRALGTITGSVTP